MKYIISFFLFLSPMAFAGMFSADHEFKPDPSCVIKGFAKSPFGDVNVNRPILCAHNKKAERTFCEGDLVGTSKGNPKEMQVIAIQNNKGKLKAYKPGNASKRAEIFTDKVEDSLKLDCQKRLAFLKDYIFEIGDADRLNKK